MTTQTFSPTQKTALDKTLDFPDALREVIKGNKITKLEWNDPSCVVQLSDFRLQICLSKNEYNPVNLIVSDGDLLGTDWVVV